MREEVQWRTFRFRVEEMFEKAFTQIRVIREQEPEKPESQPFDQEA
jgi:non-canonical (house-cleaning) NTP pyrophosphatase